MAINQRYLNIGSEFAGADQFTRKLLLAKVRFREKNSEFSLDWIQQILWRCSRFSVADNLAIVALTVFLDWKRQDLQQKKRLKKIDK